MTAQTTIIARDVFSQIGALPFCREVFSENPFENNAVVQHIVDYLGDNEYDTTEDLVRALEMAHWAAGSLGLIYNTEINDFLDCRARRADIEEIIEAYIDMTGETPKFEDFSEHLIFALDFATGEIAAAIEYYLEYNAAAA